MPKASVITEPVQVNLNVADIHPSAHNPRVVDPKSQAVRELSADFKARGVLQPLLVRPLATGGHELIDGHRRLTAAKLAKLATVPCLLRKMTDAQAAEARLAAALHHEDLSPLEEAEAFRQLTADHGLGAEDIALHVGRSVTYVKQRLLLTKLAEGPREALREVRMSLAVALVLLTLSDADDQAKAWQRLDRPGRAATADDARQLLDREFLRELDRAPWQLAKFAPKPLPVCRGCERRSDAQTDLFGDNAPAGARCLDGECWRLKMEAHVAALKARAEKAGQKVVKAGKDWVKADGFAPINGQYQNVGQLVANVGADKVETAVAIVDGKAVQVVNAKALAAAAAGCGSTGHNVEAERAAREAREDAWNAALESMVEQVVPAMQGNDGRGARLLTSLACLAVETSEMQRKVLGILGIPKPAEDGDIDVVADAMLNYAEADPTQAAQVLTACLLANAWGYSNEPEADLTDLAGLLGVELPAEE